MFWGFLLLTLAIEPNDFESMGICGKYLKNLQAEVAAHSVGAESYGTILSLKDRSVQVVDSTGDGRPLLKKSGDHWGSSYVEESQFDLQGDPRLFIDSLGIDAASHFGFEIISDNEMLGPDYRAMNVGITAINEVLRAKSKPEILISYYPVKSNIKLHRYLVNFITGYSIPLANKGNLAVHDISFHTSAIFIPSRFIKHQKLKVELVFAFLEHYRQANHAMTQEQQAALNYIERLLFLFLVRQIDEATGGMASNLKYYYTNFVQSSLPGDSIAGSLMFLAERDGFFDQIQRSFRTLRSVGESYFPGFTINKNELIKHDQQVNSADLLYELKDFANVWRGGAFTKSEKQFNYDTQKPCKEITLKRSNIRKGALFLKSQK